MMYNMFSPERAHTRPSRFAGKRRVPLSAQRRGRNEVMSFSVDFLPGWSDERGSAAPVYVDQRREKTRPYQAPLQQPVVGDFDTARIRPVSAEGMRASTAVLLLVIMLFTLGVTWLTIGGLLAWHSMRPDPSQMPIFRSGGQSYLVPPEGVEPTICQKGDRQFLCLKLPEGT